MRAYRLIHPNKVIVSTEKTRAYNNAKSAAYKLRYPDRVIATRRKRAAKNNAAAKARYLLNRELRLTQTRAYNAANREAVLSRTRAYTCKNADKLNAQVRIKYHKNIELSRANMREKAKRYPAQRRASSARHNVEKLQASPSWAIKFYIDGAYEIAALRTKITGFAWEVDHIVPLRSKLVCGLHVIDNLRVIPRTQNRAKGNRHWPDMPD